MSTVNWSIEFMQNTPDVDGLSKVVYFVGWNCTASDGVNGPVTLSGNASIELDSESQFIPYEQLTEQTVLRWVFDYLGDETKSNVENDALDSFRRSITPITKPVIDPLPW